MLVELLAIWAGAFLIGLSGAMMPGPLMIFTIGAAARHGHAAGPAVVLGHGILEFALIIGLAMGLGHFLAQPLVATVLSFLGGVALAATGAHTMYAAPKVRLSGNTSDVSAGMQPILGGALISLSNPYWSVWWASIGLAYLSASLARGFSGAAAFFVGHISADMAWYWAVSYAADKSRSFLPERMYRAIIFACGLVLLFFAALFIRRGYVGLAASLAAHPGA